MPFSPFLQSWGKGSWKSAAERRMKTRIKTAKMCVVVPCYCGMPPTSKQPHQQPLSVSRGANAQPQRPARRGGSRRKELALAGVAHAQAVNRGVSGFGESACTGAAVALTVATAAATYGKVPEPLITMVSPFKAQMEELKVLGKGGFGSVTLVRSKLDHRLLAVKQVRFRSSLPPWTPIDALEAAHSKMLREVRAMAALPDSPLVVRYFWGWVEPDWGRVGTAMAHTPGFLNMLQKVSHSSMWTSVVPPPLLLATTAAASEMVTHFQHKHREAHHSHASGSETSGSSGSNDGGSNGDSSSGSSSGSEGSSREGSGSRQSSSNSGSLSTNSVSSRRSSRGGSRWGLPTLPIVIAPTKPPTKLPSCTVLEVLGGTSPSESGSSMSASPGGAADQPMLQQPARKALGASASATAAAAIPFKTPKAAPHAASRAPTLLPIIDLPLSQEVSPAASPKFSGSFIVAGAQQGLRGKANVQKGLGQSALAEPKQRRPFTVDDSVQLRDDQDNALTMDASTKESNVSDQTATESNDSYTVSQSGYETDASEGTSVSSHSSAFLFGRLDDTSMTRNSAFTFGEPTQSGTQLRNTTLGDDMGGLEGAGGRGRRLADAAGNSTRNSAAASSLSASSSSHSDDDSVSDDGSAGDDDSASDEGSSSGKGGIRQHGEANSSDGDVSSKAGYTRGSAPRRRPFQWAQSPDLNSHRGASRTPDTNLHGCKTGTGSRRSSAHESSSRADQMAIVAANAGPVWLPLVKNPSQAESGLSASLSNGELHASPAWPYHHRRHHHHHHHHKPRGIHAGGAGKRHHHHHHSHGNNNCKPQQHDRECRVEAGGDLAAAVGITKWPWVLYIAMEAVSGLTLDVWMKQRVSLQRSKATSNSGGPAVPDPFASMSAMGLYSPSKQPGLTGAQGVMGEMEKEVFRQLVAAVAHVHAAGLLHRDIKPANVFVTPCSPANGVCWAGQPPVQVKLGDFGLSVPDEATPHTTPGTADITPADSAANSDWVDGPVGMKPAPEGAAAKTAGLTTTAAPKKGTPPPAQPSAAASIHADCLGVSQPEVQSPASRVPSSSLHTSGIGTPSYCAPEQMQGDGTYGQPADIFPLGLILIELACSFTTGMERAMAMHDARQGRMPSSMLTHSPKEAALAEHLLSHVPQDRPTAAQTLVLLHALWGPGSLDVPVPAAGSAAAAVGAAVAARMSQSGSPGYSARTAAQLGRRSSLQSAAAAPETFGQGLAVLPAAGRHPGAPPDPGLSRAGSMQLAAAEPQGRRLSDHAVVIAEGGLPDGEVPDLVPPLPMLATTRSSPFSRASSRDLAPHLEPAASARKPTLPFPAAVVAAPPPIARLASFALCQEVCDVGTQTDEGLLEQLVSQRVAAAEAEWRARLAQLEEQWAERLAAAEGRTGVENAQIAKSACQPG